MAALPQPAPLATELGPGQRGTLISVEGLDGAGKSTAVAAISEALDPLCLREPGGTELSELLRAALKGLELPQGQAAVCDSAARLLKMAFTISDNASLQQLTLSLLIGAPLALDRIEGELSADEELLLFNAARAQLVEEVIAPELEAGRTILLDRFIDSTVAYQGYGRGLDPDAVMASCLSASGGMLPDLTLLLRISPETRLARIGGRGEEDRIERSGQEFFERVAVGFDELAAAAPTRFFVIDGEQSPEEVAAQCLRAVSERIGGVRGPEIGA